MIFKRILLLAMELIPAFTMAQIYTGNNGLSVTGSGTSTNVKLGGILTEPTFIDLDNSSKFVVRKSTTEFFNIQNNGRVGIGTNSPLTLFDVNGLSTFRDHLTVDYGIANRRLQLRHDGLYLTRLSDGSYVSSITADGNMFFNTRNDYWFSNDGVLRFKVTGSGIHSIGSVRHEGLSEDNSAYRILATDANGNVKWRNASTLSGSSSGANVTVDNGITNRRVELRDNGLFFSRTSDGQYASNIIADGHMNFNTRNDFYFYSDQLIRFKIFNSGNVVIGNLADNGDRLQVGGTVNIENSLKVGNGVVDNQSPYQQGTWDTYSTRINGGNLSIFSHGTNGSSHQLSFYARYFNSGQDYITNKGGYIKAMVFDDTQLHPGQPSGRGTLVLGTSNTNYTNQVNGVLYPIFYDVPTVYLSNGNMSIGTATPTARFHTNGTVRFEGLTNNNTQSRVLVTDVNGNVSYRDASTLGGSGSSGNWTISNNDIINNNADRVGIGVTVFPAADAKFAVNGNIYARKVKVTQNGWADFVFEKNYKLLSLPELEKYISDHGHLPDVPSATEVAKDGLDVGDNQATLLRKIEELTLYIIELNKKVLSQEKVIQSLKNTLKND